MTGGQVQQSTPAGVSSVSGSVVTLECPQAVMMNNHAEGDLFMVDIQLMYTQTQQWPAETTDGRGQLSHYEQSIQAQQRLLQQQILMSRGMSVGGAMGGVSATVSGRGSSRDELVEQKRVEKSLRELLEEQDIGEF